MRRITGSCPDSKVWLASLFNIEKGLTSRQRQ
jgi:hypothetical protein